jgi:hypothetical protein
MPSTPDAHRDLREGEFGIGPERPGADRYW